MRAESIAVAAVLAWMVAGPARAAERPTRRPACKQWRHSWKTKR